MSEKRILILGASSELGLALIRKIHKDYDVILAHYNKSDEALKSLQSNLGDKLHLIKADFTSEKSTDSFIDEIENKYVCPSDIVHFPANKIRYERFHKAEWSSVEMDLSIQLRSIHKIIGRFIKPMSKLGSSNIVFVLTSNTVSAPKYMVGYTTVKFALLGFMKALASEYADKSVHINAVSPSMTETRFLSEIPDVAIRQAASDNPMKRNAVVEDIVPAIEFLLSDGAGYITGQNITISGGVVI